LVLLSGPTVRSAVRTVMIRACEHRHTPEIELLGHP
jgi:hypothetical protein